MYVQIIEFEVQGLTRAEYEAFCTDAVPAIATIPGVVGKLFLADADSSRCEHLHVHRPQRRGGVPPQRPVPGRDRHQPGGRERAHSRQRPARATHAGPR